MIVRTSLTLAVLALAGVAASLPADSKQVITTFDPPGSTATYTFGINRAGSVTGYYTDSNYTEHGFLRVADGTITSFDPSGAVETVANGINSKGRLRGPTGTATLRRTASRMFRRLDVWPATVKSAAHSRTLPIKGHMPL
jgi:hypothetical protein